MNHRSELTYTVHDDGVWICCSCGWGHCLGFSSTVAAAYAIFREHAGDGGDAWPPPTSWERYVLVTREGLEVVPPS